MENIKKKPASWIKKIIIAGVILLLAGAAVIWYIFTEKFTDTAERKAAFTVNAMDFIKEFEQNENVANQKYKDQIITVNGRVSETEPADTTINIKFTDTLTDAYIIFAFQEQHLQEAKQLKEGDSVSIKGSFSNGSYSEILETMSITFKRCAVNK